MRCCVNLIRFLFFLTNFLCFLGFTSLLVGTVYVFLNGENTFIGQNIEHSLSSADPTNAAYFSFIIFFLVILSFFALFTCLGCCGAVYNSGCMLGCFFVIFFVLCGGALGAVIFLHYQFGWQAVIKFLNQEMSRNLPTYRKENVLTYKFLNWLQPAFMCCKVERVGGWLIWTTSDGIQANWKVHESCCREGEKDCMYQPNTDTAYLEGCVSKIVLYIQILFYGIPIIMFLSLVFTFVVFFSVSTSERSHKAANDHQHLYQAQSQYSINVNDDTMQHSYPTPTAPSHGQPPYRTQSQYSINVDYDSHNYSYPSTAPSHSDSQQHSYPTPNMTFRPG